MATLTTSAEILDWVLFQASEPTDGTSDFHAHAIECLNRAYRDMWQGGGALVEGLNEPWLWLKKDPPGVLTLQPVIDTGSVSVTNNNINIIFSSAPAVSVAGRFFRVDGQPDVFRIATHTGGVAAATLDSVYTGLTNGAAVYKVMKLEYDLATDMLRVIAPMRIYKDNKQEVDGVALSALERDYPLAYIESGTPTQFALVTEDKIRFNRYGGVTSTELIRVEYDYLQEPATELTDNSTEPLVPRKDRGVLADIALFYLLTAKSDARAQEVGVQARAGLQAMADDNRARIAQMSRSQGMIYPRPGNRGRYDRLLRTSSGFILG